MRQFDSANVEVSWLGIPLKEGLAAGTFIREQRRTVQNSYKDNGYGGVVAMKTAARSGIVVLQIDRESETHQQLFSVYNLDRLTSGVSAPLMVRDSNTLIVTIFSLARIQTDPNLVVSTGPSVVPWSFIYAGVTTQAFGIAQNVVGS